MKRKDYIRDSHSNAILRKDKKALIEHRNKKNEYQRIQNAEKEIHSLKKEISYLKEIIELNFKEKE